MQSVVDGVPQSYYPPCTPPFAPCIARCSSPPGPAAAVLTRGFSIAVSNPPSQYSSRCSDEATRDFFSILRQHCCGAIQIHGNLTQSKLNHCWR